MATQIQTSLSSDIQRALQDAVGKANNAYAQSQHLELEAIKTKRARDNGDGSVNDTGQPEKKRKNEHISYTGDLTQARETEHDESNGRGESNNDKGKQPVSQPDISPTDFEAQTNQIAPQDLDLQANDNNQASAAFLSAVVAAASATSTQQLDPQYHDPHMMAGMHPPYGPYLPIPFPYDQIPQYDPSQQPLYPQPMAVPLPNLPFTSNDDILRAFQDLDVSKITSVLRTLGEAAAAATLPLGAGPAFMHPLMNQGINPPPPVGQVAAPSGTILNTNPKPSKPSHNRVLDMSLPGPEQHTNPDHAHLLATKWMNASKLAELVRSEGLLYKKGKFSAIEEQHLKTAIENFRIEKGLSEDNLSELIFQKNEKGKENSFWSEITAAVPQRPIIAVYHHVRRAFHPLKQQGKWMPSEDALLKEAVADLGQQWEKVSERVGRMSSDCRDRYRNHIANREVRVTGAWTKEEEEELTHIVAEMTIQQGKDVDNDVFWGIVSERMNNKRGRQQCRIKWTDSLSKTVKNEGHKPRWSAQDAYILVHKVDSMNVRDDTEIDWKTLPDPDWNLWSAHSLQRRWLTMKRSIKGFEDMTHQEIMDILRVKKAQLPAPSATRKRKVTSAADVHDPETNGSAESDLTLGEAGPSGSCGST